MIPRKLQDDFYAGKRGDIIKYCINDAVEILSGDYKGKRCAVISIDEINPEVILLVERGDDGSFLRIHQSAIRLIEDQTK
jgi:hypothetical protein